MSLKIWREGGVERKKDWVGGSWRRDGKAGEETRERKNGEGIESRPRRSAAPKSSLNGGMDGWMDGWSSESLPSVRYKGSGTESEGQRARETIDRE